MDVFVALADPVRRDLLRQVASGPSRVVDLAAQYEISRPAVSRHLRVLTEAGVVSATDHGRERHYRLRPEAMQPVRELLAELAPPPRVPEHVLDALDLEVRRAGRSRRDRGAALPGAHEEETGS